MQPFSRTLLALEPSSLHRLLLGLGPLLLGLWLLWALLAEITVWLPSDSARLEGQGSARPLIAQVGGRVVGVEAAVGQSVVEGQPLLQLDPADALSDARELDLKRWTMEEVLEAQQLRIDELERSIEEGRAALEADLGAQRAALRSASARRDAQAAEAGRAAELQAQGALSAQEAQRAALAGAVAEADLERARAQLRATSARGEAELGRLIADLEVQRGALRRLEAEAGGVEASVDRSARQLDRHAISAPVDGELADLAPLGPGDVVEVGQVLGHVVPDGEIEVAARYAPGPALGRLEVGQRARLRLEGFPWTEHGSLEATVAQVSSELREGQIEVRLRLDHPPEGLPLQHGLPGTVEVAVEGASPARLALRAAGLMGGPRRD